MDISGIIAWVQNNWVNIIAVYTSLVTIASIIVKLTPSLRDDDALLAVVKFIAKYMINSAIYSDLDHVPKLVNPNCL